MSFDKFADDAYPRIDADMAAQKSIKYQATGAISESGPIYKIPCSFNVNAYITPAQERDLDLIWIWHEHQRSNKQPAHILVMDQTRPFRELLPRSRGAVPNTDVIETYAGLGVAYADYFATFLCWMDKQPVYFNKGKKRAASFTLYESGRTSP